MKYYLQAFAIAFGGYLLIMGIWYLSVSLSNLSWDIHGWSEISRDMYAFFAVILFVMSLVITLPLSDELKKH